MVGSRAGGAHPPPIARLERFRRVASTQDVVRAWLAEGQAEICLAVADQQTAGRGRLGRRWLAPPGCALLVSAGFRPLDLPLAQAWRLPATTAMAMLDAATALLPPGADRLALKWPNDIVIVREGHLRKVGGVLAETEVDGERLVSAVVGLGVNVDWPAMDFPSHLAATMGSLREAAPGPVDRETLLSNWLARLAPLYGQLLAGRFDGARWADAQVTTAADVTVETGSSRLQGRAVGVDIESGALLVLDPASGEVRGVGVGEVVACIVGGSARSL